jgi:hypothetical protein
MSGLASTEVRRVITPRMRTLAVSMVAMMIDM